VLQKALKQSYSIKTMCPNYILEFRNTKSHLLHVYQSTWAKIVVKKNHVC